MGKVLVIIILGICLFASNNSNAQVITLSNFDTYENSYYKKDRINKSKLSSNDLNLTGLSKNTNSISPSLLMFTIKPDEENRDALFECEGNLTSLWKQYQKSCLENKVKINYLELYEKWQTKDKFCTDLLDKLALKLFFNFITPGKSAYYLQQIIVQKLAYPGTRGEDVARDWMSGFQRENGFQLIVLTPSFKDDIIDLTKPLVIEKQGTLNVNLSSKHYQYLVPGSLQQGNYVIKLKFVFSDGANEKHFVSTPDFLVKI